MTKTGTSYYIKNALSRMVLSREQIILSAGSATGSVSDDIADKIIETHRRIKLILRGKFIAKLVKE